MRISVRRLRALADDLMARGKGMRWVNPSIGHGIAVADGGFDGFGERRDTRHVRMLPG